MFKPSIPSTGFIGLVGAEETFRLVNISRDSGIKLSLICKHGVPSPKCYNGEKVLVAELTGISYSPIRKVYFRSDLVNGRVELGVVDYIPATEISVIIGIDLEGSRKWNYPIVTSWPRIYQRIPKN